jgi:hypothetical protein
MPDTQQGPSTGDRYNTYNTATKGGWKDTAIIVTLTLNIMALFAIVFGGMNWVTQVNANMAIISSRQEMVLKTIKEIQEFDLELVKRHAVEDALATKRNQ